MKLSYNWLKEYLEFDLSPQQVADAMTSIGIEVDSVEEQEEIPGGLAGVVVAEVVECEPHPDSDHLHITKVDDGSGELLTVVCGAPNVAKGEKVLFARIGTVLPGDFKIKKSKIRGVESFGMICAEDELGIGEGHEGIMVLPDGAVVGTAAKDYLGLKTEAVIEYELTANRVDAASHWGVARDIYAYLRHNGQRCKLKFPEAPPVREAAGEGLKIEVLDPDGAPRYSGVTIRGVKVASSPEWLQKRLTSIGLHPINNIVDISNFILFELGQPLHIFDADKVSGSKVVVRRAAEGEKIVTLDEMERKLCAEDMVIADERAPMCIAGVFGGLESGVTDKTVNVFVESAYFDPGSIRKTSKRHALQTDASFRFERGADPEMVPAALRRAVLLITKIAGGSIAGTVREVYGHPAERRKIELDYGRIQEFIGQRIGEDVITDILESLNYTFLSKSPCSAVVLAPSYMIDVYRECDVVEEILRIYGYNNIDLPKHMKMSVNATPSPDPEAVRNHISNFLAAQGFAEIMNNSLTKGAYYDKLETFPAARSVNILNPLSSDLNVMRQTLIPGALEVVAYNMNRQQNYIKTFEYGSVYQRLPEKDGASLEGYEEHPCFCITLSGTPEKNWDSAARKTDFFQLKGCIELLLRRFGAELSGMNCEAAPHDVFSEGLVYSLQGSEKQLLAMGTINPSLAKNFSVKQPVYIAEINWDELFKLIKRDKVQFKEMPKFPEVRRDLALLLDETVKYADLQLAARKSVKKLLKQLSLFDVYRGEKIPQGKKQYALSFIFQDLEKTLTDQDVERAMEKLLSVFSNEFGASLR